MRKIEKYLDALMIVCERERESERGGTERKGETDRIKGEGDERGSSEKNADNAS